MIKVLVSGSTATMRRFCFHENLGVFFNPKSRHNYRTQPVNGLPWAADNAAYKGFDAQAFELMLDTLHARRLPGCLFVTVPDVVADAKATIANFVKWAPRLRRYGWPLAFVAQDGLHAKATPWDQFDVLFLGGSTRWKLGIHAYTLAAYAKALGKHVHVGRVNSALRTELFADVADSIDGTATSMFGDIYIPKMLRAAQEGVKHGPRTPQMELAL